MKKKTRLLFCSCIFSLLVFGCANPRETSRMTLGQMNVPYSEDSFVDRARDGDIIPVRLFLDAGMAPDAANKYGQTALLVAARYGRSDILSLLLARGANPNVRDKKYGATPLIWASVGGYTPMVRELLDHEATLEDHGNRSGLTALMSAASNGHGDVVALLLERGAEINARDDNGRTALMWAANRGKFEAARVLLEKGADMGAREKTEGLTALTGAAMSGETEVVGLLLMKGAAINDPDDQGRTPLMLAAKDNRVAVVKLLLEAGADAGARDHEGRTALDQAKVYQRQDVIKVLEDPPAKKKAGFEMTLRGKIGYMKEMGGYYLYGTPEGYRIENQNEKFLGEFAKRGKTVTVKGRVSVNSGFLTIETIDGKPYQGSVKPYSGK